MELQNARTIVIGVGNYSVLINIIKHLSVRLIKAFQLLSAMQHYFLGLDRKQAVLKGTQTGNINQVRSAKKQGRSSNNNNGNNNNANKSQSREAVLIQRDKKEKAVCKAIQQVLSQQDVRFCLVEQELVLHAVINRQTLLIIVLLTSRGKSLLFSVLACIDNASVIVVVVLY